MYQATMTVGGTLRTQQQRRELMKSVLWMALLIALFALMMIEPAWATGTGTTTGTGGAGNAQTRITAVATGWQNIVMGIGVAILVIAWAIIGYAIAFNGKTMKDCQGPAIGSTIAGLAPVIVGWLFS